MNKDKKLTNKKLTKTIFVWQGVDQKGQEKTGEIQALSFKLAEVYLLSQGLVVKKLKKKNGLLRTIGKKKIKRQDITLLTRQMATLIQAGLPLIQLLDVIAKSNEHIEFADLIQTIKDSLEAGHSFSESLKKHPRYFNAFYCQMVAAGEQTGSLEKMFEQLAVYREKMDALRSKIQKALFYPSLIFAVALTVSALLLTVVIPQFETLYQSFGAELPAFTQLVVTLSTFMIHHGTMLGLGFGLFTLGLFWYHRYSKPFRYACDRFKLKLPLFGHLIQYAVMAKFSRSVAITFSAGMPLVNALQLASTLTGNLVYTEASLKLCESISNGKTVNLAMKETGVFTSMAVQMVGLGEESGSLDTMLNKIADIYEEKVDGIVNNLSSLLEPVLMIVIGLIVGALVMAMYLPIFKLGHVL